MSRLYFEEGEVQLSDSLKLELGLTQVRGRQLGIKTVTRPP
jgi:hypothetical protein